MNFAVLIDPKVYHKGSKNIDKYLELARKLGGAMKLSFIIGTLGIVPKTLKTK